MKDFWSSGVLDYWSHGKFLSVNRLNAIFLDEQFSE